MPADRAGPIYLLHIPKTGGQTLATRLAAGFPPARVNVLRSDVADPAALADLAAAHDFFEGHPAPGALAAPPPGLRVMAAVREPVAQIVSHYRHIRREPAHALHAAAQALAPTAFLDRFAHHLFDFQAACLVAAFRAPRPADRIRGFDLWLLRHLEPALDRLAWALPSERIDEFCLLWRLDQGGAPIGDPAQRVNTADAADGVDAEALEHWLRRRAHRFAADAALWAAVGRRFEAWRHGLLTTDAAGTPAPAHCAWQAGQAAVWLTRDWHAPLRRSDGVLEWGAGPGLYPLLRVRRGGHATLRFEALSLLGVHWDRMRAMRADTLDELPLRRTLDPATGIVACAVDIADLPAEAALVLYAPEDPGVLPPVQAAFTPPRRGFATQHWRLE